MKLTIYEDERIVSTEELKGFILNLIGPDGDSNLIGISQNNTKDAEVYEKEIPLADGKRVLLLTRHAPDLQPLYDIMDGYKGLILIDMRYQTTHIIIEW